MIELRLALNNLSDESGLFGVKVAIKASDFYAVDVSRILYYAGGLILFALLIALVPTWHASRISPVEAIRQAD